MNIKALVTKVIREKNFVSLMGNVSFSFFGLVSFFILVRSLDKTDFGDWIVFVTIAGFVDLFRFGLTRNPIIRFASGVGEEEKKSLLGTSFLIGLALVLGITVLLQGLLLLPVKITGGYLLFVKFYPVYALANLSWNNALSFLQSEQKFERILIVRSVNIISFVIFLTINFFTLRVSVEGILIANIITNSLSSLFSIYAKKDGLAYIKLWNKEKFKQIFDYGKFSIGSIIGSSLLKSADVFIIGLNSAMGSVALAIYAIPLKLIELLNTPLRSFMATAFPKMSSASLNNNTKEFKDLFYSYSGALTILFIGISLGGFLLAKPLVLILGGNEYRDSLELQVLIFRLFTVYGVLLPLDRMYGVALDSLGIPRLNMIKVAIMAGMNIIGDLIMVFVFESLLGVALVTLVFTIAGIFIGHYYLSRELQIRFITVFHSGVQFYRELPRKALKK